MKDRRIVFLHIAFLVLGLLGSIGAPAQAPQAGPPAWPQAFSLRGPQSATFGIPVTQAGSITLSAQWRGGPLRVQLQGGATPLDQVVTSPATLTVTAAPGDVQVSPIWHVLLTPASPSDAVDGSLSVQSPPVDAPALQRLSAASAQQQQLLAKKAGAESAAQLSQTRTRLAASAATNQEVFRRHRLEALDQQLGAMRAMHDRLRSGPTARGLQPPAPSRMATLPQSNSQVSAPALQQLPLQVMPVPVMRPPIPSVASASVTGGRPGDPVAFFGSGFGAGGEVHFMVGPNTELKAQVSGWSDTIIVATVPLAIVATGYDGQVYVVRSADGARSAVLPFHYDPALEMRELRSTLNRNLAWPVDNASPPDYVKRYSFNVFTGFSGTDQLFTGLQLSNGWVVDGVEVACVPGNCMGGALPLPAQRGSGNPQSSAYWWLNAAPFGGKAELDYTFVVRIVGPLNLPDGILCTSPVCALASGQATEASLMDALQKAADSYAQMMQATSIGL